MLMDDFSKWKQGLKEAVDQTLETDVADVLREHVMQSVETNVYDVYSPSMYVRRRSRGGLQDPMNYPVYVSDNTLEMRNETRDNGYSRLEDRYIVDVVESGNGYDYYSPGPRPFMEEALQAGITDGSLEDALIRGVKSRGY